MYVTQIILNTGCMRLVQLLNWESHATYVFKLIDQPNSEKKLLFTHLAPKKLGKLPVSLMLHPEAAITWLMAIPT